MSVFKILNFRRFLKAKQCNSLLQNSIKTTKLESSRNYASSADTNNKFSGLWNFTKRWDIGISIGIGVSLIAIFQWRHLRRHPYPPDSDAVKGPISDLMVDCYCSLPLRITSRIFGWFANLEIPKGLRPAFFKFYAKTFNANLQEIDCDLQSFPSLVDFFVRPLKNGARPIAQHCEIVSPTDGTVVHFGPVTSCRVEQVKGVTYNLRHFLGDIRLQDEKTEFTTEENDNYVKSLLINPDNDLYQLTVYLAPGDYHRFHSATDWRIDLRRHFQGKLLSVNPKIASWLPDLFSINERVVYLGEWASGFMAYAAIGATNVGSIKVYCDKNLTTNKRKWRRGKFCDDANLDCINISKGELFGEFRMGSTVVLLFEASKDFQFAIKPGQLIKVGQALTEHPVESDDKIKSRVKLNEHAVEAIKRISTHKRT